VENGKTEFQKERKKKKRLNNYEQNYQNFILASGVCILLAERATNRT
jgi:hypothetical protein